MAFWHGRRLVSILAYQHKAGQNRVAFTQYIKDHRFRVSPLRAHQHPSQRLPYFLDSNGKNLHAAS